jgi:hypothetical protein
MIGCEVEFTDEFEIWWDALLASEQDDVAAIVLSGFSTLSIQDDVPFY